MRYLAAVMFAILIGSAHAGSVIDFGAKGDGVTDDTKAVQAAVDDGAAKGEKVIFPAGTFMTGTIVLRSNTAIEIGPKTVWKGIGRVDAYPMQRPRGFAGKTHAEWRAMIYAEQVSNVSISGLGTIEFNGGQPVFEKIPENPNRPFGVWIVRSRDIRIEGIRMRNSAHWMLNCTECDRVRISGVDIFNHINLNDDGLDLVDCRDVIVANSKIDSSDDALVLKSESERGNEDIVISDCILSSHASAFKMGTGSIGGFVRLTMNNIVIRPPASDHIEHPMKMKNGLAGIDIMSTDGGRLEDIIIQNVIMDSVETPIVIKLGDRWTKDSKIKTPKSGAGVVKNVLIGNVIARRIGPIPSQITGYPGHNVENITLDNIVIEAEGGQPAFNEPVPENSSDYPYNRIYGRKLPSYGFFVRHARNIQFRNVRLETIKPDGRCGMLFNDAEGALENVQIVNKGAKGSVPVVIDKEKKMKLRGSSKDLKIKAS